MIVATYVAFEDDLTIGESVRTVKQYVDRIVVVDSSFVSNPVRETSSRTNQRQIVNEAAGDTPLDYVVSGVKLTEVGARNLTLEYLGPADWAFVIDGDETLLGDHNELGSFFRRVRMTLALEAFGVKVLTSAVLFKGHAPEMTKEHYESAPIIHTRGVQPRVFRAMGTEWRATPKGTVAPFRGRDIVTPTSTDPRPTIVNHHVRQSFEGYQADYEWETAQRK